MSVLKFKDQNNNWITVPAGGRGVPSGGTEGQYLKKSSSSDYNTEWDDFPIPEYGSNTNGSYVKFADGTLIQWGLFTKTSGSTSAYGSLYIMQVSFDLPLNFVDTNYTVTGSGKFGTGAALAFGLEGGTVSTAQVRVWDIATRTLSSSLVLYVRWMAVGRWK